VEGQSVDLYRVKGDYLLVFINTLESRFSFFQIFIVARPLIKVPAYTFLYYTT